MTANKILELARSQIGITEYPANSNNVKYNTAYYGHAVNGKNYAWCAVFVWWLFKTAGASNLYFGGDKTASCTTLMKYYKAIGRLVTDYKPGDIVFYQFDKDSYADHVGVIENTEKDYITAIEGNTSERGSQTNGGAVLRKRRKKSLIYAVARPYYEEKDDDDMKIYKTLDDIPEWGYDTIKKLVDKGFLKGDGDGLNISYDLLRTLVILDRAGLFDINSDINL